MSTANFTLDAEKRSDKGKGASRRLRHNNQLPAIVYGGGEEPTSITLAHNKVVKALSFEAFYSHILDLKIGKKSEKVILKAVQRHPAKPLILHMDFQRIKADQPIHMSIPLHFINEDKAPGHEEGGIFSHLMTEVEITCLPADLPEFITVDVSAMALNDSIQLSAIKLPKGVEIKALAHDAESHDQAIINLHLPRIIEDEPTAEDETTEGEDRDAENAEKSAGNDTESTSESSDSKKTDNKADKKGD